ncbi:MAG TPA: aminoacyl-tRNA deacylase [Deltaproteobacteria bacterium]|nr:aminoacyl-tRNA deacylase [Deltaproteobacteria bacterium]
MSADGYPVTQAIRALREMKIHYTPHLYPYEDHGGTRLASTMLQVDEHSVIKTLIMETDQHRALIVLMHGDCEVSTKQLARHLGTKRVSACDESTAQRYTGYQVGGISPFGTRVSLKVFAEETIFGLNRIFINGGKRGFMVEIDPGDLERIFSVERVRVANSPL